MKRTLLSLLLLCAFATTFAQTVSIEKARSVAQQYIAIYEPELANAEIQNLPQLIYYDNYNSPVIYAFNIGNHGFILAGANRSFAPVVGYSLNGVFDSSRLPDNLKVWLDNYVEDVNAVKASATKSSEITRQQTAFQTEWKALENGDATFYTAKGGKAVDALVETRWDQGTGYNNYCPIYNGSHAVTGCVATAMAQIIRYHRYPSTGFYHRNYVHSAYGALSAHFDSTVYDYSQMPISVHYYSNAAQQHAVSQLCYHCGIAVRMNYQNPSHTSGSGAHSEDVPEALQFFGYFNSYYLGKSVQNSTYWDSLLRHDLDLGRPVYYSGSNSEGGHAFVCDGYRNNGTYHFNFGWSGYGDGFYSLTSVNGYSSGQGAVFNIIPSNLGPMNEVYYISSDGEGDGSGWNSAHPSINNAMTIMGMYKRGEIWVKNGTYCGDTNSDYAFTIPNGITIYGGFNGTEISIEERNLQNSATILSGDGKRAVLLSPNLTTSSRIYDITLANGLAETGAAAYIYNTLRLERCRITNNTVTDTENGAAIYSREGSIYCCIFNNNHGGSLYNNLGLVKNCLFVHNDGFGIKADGGSIDGSDIVCNRGTGIINNNVKIRNSIIWRNDSSLSNNNISQISFSAIEGFGEKDSNSNFGISHINRPDNCTGPFFVNPDTTVGPTNNLGDWRLSSLSPLVNAGDTIRTGSYVIDLAGGNRFRSGRTDIGCYEQDPYVGIETPVETASLHIYPNPASTTLCIESTPGTVQIFDAMGRCVLNAETSEERTIVNVGNLQRGVYLIRINNITSKFIKK